jgi:hypothetical protein
MSEHCSNCKRILGILVNLETMKGEEKVKAREEAGKKLVAARAVLTDEMLMALQMAPEGSVLEQSLSTRLAMMMEKEHEREYSGGC